MFQAKDLSEEQVAKLKEWTAQGDQLADLQRRLKEEFSLSVTYMDMRFVASDLGLEFVKAEEPEPEPEPEEETPAPAPSPAATAPGVTEGYDPFGGGVTVTLDSVAVPGTMVSGRVTFSDGQGARWMIDEMGRPSLDPDTANYQPAQQDIADFQVELRKLLEGNSTLGL